MPHFSAIMIVKNEERNIARCLRSLDWVDEVIVHDTGSSDRTCEIARSFPNCTVFEGPWVGFGENKRRALARARHRWILWVDGDEELSADLITELKAFQSSPSPGEDSAHAWQMPRLTFFAGTPVRHGGWYPGYVLRLFDREWADFDDRLLHEGLVLRPGARVRRLNGDLRHHSYPTVSSYFSKMVFYGPYGARDLQRRGIRFGWWRLLAHPLHSFIKHWILRRGFLDGSVGLIIAIGSGFSTFMKYALLFRMDSSSET